MRNANFERALSLVEAARPDLFHCSLRSITLRRVSEMGTSAGRHFRTSEFGAPDTRGYSRRIPGTEYSVITIANRRTTVADFAETLIHELTHMQQHVTGRRAQMTLDEAETEAHRAGLAAFAIEGRR